MADAIYKARVFVLPSNTEGVPNTLIEAMVMGLTVISTDCPCGGPADLIKDGVNGLLTPVGDVDKMKENLHRLIKDVQMADRLGKAAVKTGRAISPRGSTGSGNRFYWLYASGRQQTGAE